MYESWASSDASRKIMRANRSRDTRAELAVRRLVHAAGLRYRVNVRPEPDFRRTADILFRQARVVVLIDGCYWHGCPEHFKMPSTNRGYWEDKIRRNRLRDIETTRLFEARDWMVLRFWEHEAPSTIAANIVDTVRARREVTPKVRPSSPSNHLQ
jgi:DNA mismatch endonuclease, patch repair protein